jgi:hypothetical protein
MREEREREKIEAKRAKDLLGSGGRECFVCTGRYRADGGRYSSKREGPCFAFVTIRSCRSNSAWAERSPDVLVQQGARHAAEPLGSCIRVLGWYRDR